MAFKIVKLKNGNFSVVRHKCEKYVYLHNVDFWVANDFVLKNAKLA